LQIWSDCVDTATNNNLTFYETTWSRWKTMYSKQSR